MGSRTMVVILIVFCERSTPPTLVETHRMKQPTMIANTLMNPSTQRSSFGSNTEAVGESGTTSTSIVRKKAMKVEKKEANTIAI